MIFDFDIGAEMRRISPNQRLLVLWITVLLLVGGCDSGIALRPLAPSDTILAFGDSLTFGTGAPRGESYPDHLAHLSGIKVIRSGIPGEKTPQGLKRLATVLEEHSPALVILCEGGNDILRKVPREQTINNLTAMIEMIRDSGAEVVLVSVPAFGLFPSSATFYQQIAEEQQVVIEDEIIPKVLRDRRLKSDPIHPNSTGYRLIAEAIMLRLQQAGAL